MSIRVGPVDVRDSANVHIGNKIYQTNDTCFADLRLTDPIHDKERIKNTKGGILKDAYRWILDDADFRQWRDDEESRLLWIKGDPGKGKTMLLIGITEELEQQSKQTTQDPYLLSYFFCQGTDKNLRNATSVLRGLIYLLCTQEQSLESHVRKHYGRAGKRLFEDANAFFALSGILKDMLGDSNLKKVYLIIDALDECETDLHQLLALVVQIASTFPHVKWIVSSRNEPDIEARIRLNNSQRLSLELNADHVSHAVNVYINYKVSQLPSVEQDSELQEKVRNQIREKANGTFLWVALVFQELQRIQRRHVLRVLEDVPADLPPLYRRMIKHIEQLKYDRELCYLVLSTVIIAYRPLHLLELGTISGLSEHEFKTKDDLEEIVKTCGSFLTIREDYVYFIHQSAKDYLESNASGAIFPAGHDAFQYDLFSRSIKAMSETLQKPIYKLRQPGISIDLAKPPLPDPLAPLRYSCVYWARHFDKVYQSDLTDGGKIHRFLQNCFLYWLEALSLCRGMSEGMLSMAKLETLVQVILGLTILSVRGSC
jgi:NACHT domain